MKKTSIYLDDIHLERLCRLAEIEGKSQAEVIRDAIIRYTTKGRPDRNFALAKFALENPDRRDGRSIADIPEEELMRGFGE